MGDGDHWASDPPPALISLRRTELVRDRNAAIAKLVGTGVAIAAGVAITVLAYPHAGPRGFVPLIVSVAGLGWAVRSIITIRHTQQSIAAIDARPALPEARVVEPEP